jgi:alpha/beta hydrolase fold
MRAPKRAHIGGGPARRLLFLQHFMGTLDNWDPSVADPLASGRKVILFDSAGVGRSTGTVPGTVDAMAAHVLAFLDGVGVATCDVLRFSLGGRAADRTGEAVDLSSDDSRRHGSTGRARRHAPREADSRQTVRRSHAARVRPAPEDRFRADRLESGGGAGVSRVAGAAHRRSRPSVRARGRRRADRRVPRLEHVSGERFAI